MQELMRLKETEKGELERMTLNKTDALTMDEKLRSTSKGRTAWTASKDKA
jgi:hypothetical protein